MKRVDLRFAAALLLLLCLFALIGRPGTVTADVAEARGILINERLSQAAGRETIYRFTPPSNNIYIFQSFSDASVEATLYAQDQTEVIAYGEGFQFEARLKAEDIYYLKVSVPEGARDCSIEIMRAAFGRCYDRPIEFIPDSAGYNKVIARAYDTHWYRFIARSDGYYTVRTSSTMDTVGYLLDAGGRTVAYSNGAYAPYKQDFYMQANLKAGDTYYVRVCASEDQIGQYRLFVTPPVQGAPPVEKISFIEHELRLTDGEEVRLSYAFWPGNAQPDVIYISSQPGIASVGEDGVLSAHGPGAVEIVVLAGTEVYDICAVTVVPVRVEGIVFIKEDITLTVAQELALEYMVLPPGASNSKIVFESSNEDVASIDEKGLLTAVSAGEVVITATTEDGGYTAQAVLTIKKAPPKYRALLLGEQKYVDDKTRIGSVNSTQGMADMLSSLNFDGETYSVTMRMDSTRADVIRRIRFTFRDATENDVSLFYINCHGDYKDGVAYIKFHDSTQLTAQQLERELRRIPGTVVVMIDCCKSGSFLSGEVEAFGQSVVQAFSRGAASSFAMTKYQVLTSTASTQNSHRISYEKFENEATTTTIFADSLCAGAGWNLLKDKIQSMKADIDRNRTVTLHEAYLYTRRKTHEVLTAQEKLQDVQIYPMGSSFPLFQRN